MRSGPEQERRPRLTPAIADVRRAVREGIAGLPAGSVVLVGLSGGRDSLALAAATAFEAPRAFLRAGAVIVDHGLQEDSAVVAERVAATARDLGLDPVLVRRVTVQRGADDGGPEAAARAARFAAFEDTIVQTGAERLLLGHTLDDQAESVLLGLARGSGAGSLAGMRALTGRIGRPLLGVRRATTGDFCADSGLTPWDDPHNADPAFLRVRVRSRVLPVLEAELGPGVSEALARTALQLQEDSDALDGLSTDWAAEMAEHADAGIAIRIADLQPNPDAIAARVVRYVVLSEFGVSLSHAQTRAVMQLVRDWRGQKGVDLPGVRVVRIEGRLRFTSTRELTEGR